MGVSQVEVQRSRMHGALRREHQRTRNVWHAQLRELTRFDHANPESRMRILGYMRQLTNEAMHQRIDQSHRDATDDFFEQFRFRRTTADPTPTEILVPETPLRPNPPMIISQWETPIDQVSDSEWQYVDDLEENPRPTARRRLNFDTPEAQEEAEDFARGRHNYLYGRPETPDSEHNNEMVEDSLAQEFEEAMLATPSAVRNINNAAAFRARHELNSPEIPDGTDEMPSVFDEVNEQ